MTGAQVEHAWEHPITAFHVKHTMEAAVQSNQDIALYSKAAKGRVMLRIITNQEILVR